VVIVREIHGVPVHGWSLHGRPVIHEQQLVLFHTHQSITVKNILCAKIRLNARPSSEIAVAL
jgi:hypothetical protein